MRLTNETNGLASKLESALPAHVLAATTGRPKSHHILEAKEQDQRDLHVEEYFVGRVCVRLDGRQHAEYETRKNRYESRNDQNNYN